VFPQDSETDALERLWRAVSKAARVDPIDSRPTWKAHLEKLKAGSQAMNSRNFSAIHFQGPDTDLFIALADGHTWTSPIANWP